MKSSWSLEGDCEKSPDGIACRSIPCIGREFETLGKDLAVEARAPDGVIEAFRVADAPNFALSVQWHPEWQFADESIFPRAVCGFW